MYSLSPTAQREGDGVAATHEKRRGTKPRTRKLHLPWGRRHQRRWWPTRIGGTRSSASSGPRIVQRIGYSKQCHRHTRCSASPGTRADAGRPKPSTAQQVRSSPKRRPTKHNCQGRALMGLHSPSPRIPEQCPHSYQYSYAQHSPRQEVRNNSYRVKTPPQFHRVLQVDCKAGEKLPNLDSLEQYGERVVVVVCIRLRLQKAHEVRCRP
jgi:hypothetical protein